MTRPGVRQTLVLCAGLAGIVSLAALARVSGPAEPAAWAQGAGAAVRYAVVAERSEARYRVREQLVGVSLPNDAVGATRVVEGHIALDARGQVLAGESRFTVDLRTLRSDEPRRDNYIRRNTLETDRYPTVTFVPAELRGLRVPLPSAGPASFEVVGDLTVREATRRLTWEATASFSGEEASVRARAALRFGDVGLRIPRVSVVLGVEDDIRLEADLLLRRSP